MICWCLDSENPRPAYCGKFAGHVDPIYKPIPSRTQFHRIRPRLGLLEHDIIIGHRSVAADHETHGSFFKPYNIICVKS